MTRTAKPRISNQWQQNLNYFTYLTVFMDAVHVSQAVLHYRTYPQPGTITNVRRINKFNYILFADFPSENELLNVIPTTKIGL